MTLLNTKSLQVQIFFWKLRCCFFEDPSTWFSSTLGVCIFFKILSVGTKPYQCWYQCLSVALFPFPFSYPACVTRTKEFLNASFISWNSVKKPFTECSQNLLCRVNSHLQHIASMWLEEKGRPSYASALSAISKFVLLSFYARTFT